MKYQVLNSKGQPIELTPEEKMRAAMLQRNPEIVMANQELANSMGLENALGFEINITTLTEISKSITEQKFFEIPIADYLPVRVGNNAWSSNIVTYRSFELGGDFEAGNINTGASNSRLAEADSGVDTLTNPVVNWAKKLNYTIFDLKLAAKSGNWDLVTSKERARKKNWDLGIQKIAFLGSSTNAAVLGLLNQSTVNVNTTLITAFINSLSSANFAVFVQSIIEAYRSNCARTAFPTHFIIPEGDYNGLATPVSPTYPNITMLDYLLQAFKLITRNPNFKILPCAYCDKANSGTINKNTYVLLNYDEDSLRMDVPVPYGNTLQNTINGFQFENVGYGQYTGALAYRPLEMLYFQFG